MSTCAVCSTFVLPENVRCPVCKHIVKNIVNLLLQVSAAPPTRLFKAKLNSKLALTMMASNNNKKCFLTLLAP